MLKVDDVELAQQSIFEGRVFVDKVEVRGFET
jgi:hypothetical protein